MRRVLVYTFGCKLNQFDSQAISESFASEGYLHASDATEADVCVVNSCSVTARSDYQTRQLVRRVHRANPGALILVTGCYAERAHEEVARVEGVGMVVGNSGKSSLPRFVEDSSAGAGKRVGSACAQHAPVFPRRSRALVRIQDGCDAFCSFCIVPYVRGRSRSEQVSAVKERVTELESSGFNEIVLTGARIGSYGKDLGEDASLVGLLEALLSSTRRTRFRLSSLEPLEISDSLLDLVGREKRICRHFHVPLQSGDKNVLEGMRRPYSPGDYAERIESIKSRFPDACIGSDVIVGFPGESDGAFESTRSLIERLPLSYLHVFPFSRRPGTRAWSMDEEPASSLKRTRARVLRELGAKKRSDFAESQVGALAEVVLEEEVEPDLFRGTTGNYLKVLVRAEGGKAREAVHREILHRDLWLPDERL